MKGYNYSIVGTRMSGESTTTYGNTLINFLIQSYFGHTHGLNVAPIVCGDDSITGCDQNIDEG